MKLFSLLLLTFLFGAGYLQAQNANTFPATGKVGLGTLVPVSKLHVFGAGGLRVSTLNNGANNTDWIAANFGAADTFITFPRVVMGYLNGTPTIGAHNYALTAWNNLSLNPGGGNVGVGTSTPLAKLDVAGNVKITDGTQGVGKVLTSDANGLANWQLPSALTGWSFNGNNIYNSNAGNVGIGTANPVAPLTLSNVLAKKKIAVWDAANNGGTSNDNQFLGLGDSAGQLRYQVGNALVDNHVFLAGTSPTTSVELMRITGTGKVGIGTNAPAAKLDVAGNIKIADGTQGVGKVLTSDAAGAASWQALSGLSGWSANGSTVFNTALDSGKVGIGTSSPATKVSIVGSGGLKVSTKGNSKLSADWIAGNFGGADTSVYGRVVLGSIAGTPTIGGHNTALTAWNNLSINPGGGNVGVGTSTPIAKLDIAGNVKITDGTQGVGKVLTSDANGLASWQPLTASTGWVIAGNNIYNSNKLCFRAGTV